MKYKSLEDQHLIETLHEGDDDLSEVVVKPRRRVSPTIAFLASSVVLNLALAFLLLPSKVSLQHSDYAKLTWDKPGMWVNSSEFMDVHHRTKTDQAWEKIEFDPGIVAISDEEAQSMGLPRSQRFPWDDTKGIYLINAYHNLHCLKWLWTSLAKFRDGGTFGHQDWHGFHCLDSLRQDTICAADDTPRYSGEGQDNEGSGNRQVRQCRDWNKLEQWAQDRSACYRFIGNDVDDLLDRHKFCPKGSPYNDVIAEVYGPNERQRLIELYGDVAV